MSIEDKIRQKIEKELADKKAADELKESEKEQRKERYEENFVNASYIVKELIAPSMNTYKKILEEKEIASSVSYSLGDRAAVPSTEPFAQFRMFPLPQRASLDIPTAVTISARCSSGAFIILYGVILGDSHYVKNTSNLPFDAVTEESVIRTIDKLIEGYMRHS